MVREETRTLFGVIVTALAAAALAVYVAFLIINLPVITEVDSRTAEGERFTMEFTCSPASVNNSNILPAGLKGCWVSTSYKTEPPSSNALSVNEECRNQTACVFVPENEKKTISICYSDDLKDGIRFAWRKPADGGNVNPFGISIASAIYGKPTSSKDYKRVDKFVRIGSGVSMMVYQETKNETINADAILRSWFAIPITSSTVGLDENFMCNAVPNFNPVQVNLTYALLRPFPNYQYVHAYKLTDPLAILGSVGGAANILFYAGLMLVVLYRLVFVYKCRAPGSASTSPTDEMNRLGSKSNAMN